MIRSSLQGVINNASFPVSYKGNRSFPLFGTGIQYQVNGSSQLYGNFSQAYRPYLYASVTPAEGATGIVPAYHVWDWSADWSFLKHYHFSAGVNNLADTRYFTRRINMYPGPGILPADGRTFYVSLGLKL